MKRSYTESLYYHIRLTARYIKTFAEQLFEAITDDISFEEFIALDIIANNKQICQRDLAKLIFKDRATTGRMASSLEELGLIKIVIDTKNNRLVKMLEMTKKGESLRTNVIKCLKPSFQKMSDFINENEEQKMIELLTKFREAISTVVSIQI